MDEMDEEAEAFRKLRANELDIESRTHLTPSSIEHQMPSSIDRQIPMSSPVQFQVAQPSQTEDRQSIVSIMSSQSQSLLQPQLQAQLPRAQLLQHSPERNRLTVSVILYFKIV